MNRHARGVLDTSIIAALSLFDPAELPIESAITAVTLGELSRGPYATDDPIKRARRIAVLQHTEATFGDALPYDSEAARIFGLICASVYAIGRQPRRRTADLMIAATAARNGLPLYTTNPKDFEGLDDLVTIMPVARPDGATG
ncbi:type II toxin-antitoxin system VapC family toxin [Nocardia sp. NPDC005746]|uniref:type II toxin-antitoxin system VapC family toxin n=1 Tax=unclassified Nocardia TaxID=2637762 RepID=UPI0033D4FBA4